MADAMLQSAEHSPRASDVLGKILDDMNASSSKGGEGCPKPRPKSAKKRSLASKEQPKSSSKQAKEVSNSADNQASNGKSPTTPSNESQDWLLAQVMQQNMNTQQLISSMTSSISKLGDTMASFVNQTPPLSLASATVTRPPYDERGEGGSAMGHESSDELSDCGGNGAMEDLFDDADSSAVAAEEAAGALGTADDSTQMDESSDILDSLLQDYTNEDLLGPPIQPKLAEAMNNMMFKKMPEEKLKEKLSVYKSPQNCELVKTSKVNPEIWTKLKSQERSNDIKMQKLQAPVLRAAVPLLHLASDLLKVKNKEMSVQQLDIKQLAKQATDAISLLAHVNTELNYRRREMIRPHLNKQFQQLCSPQTPMSTLLFGDNLAETIKSMSMTNRLAQQLTYSQQRPAPYHKPFTAYKTPSYATSRNHGNPVRGRGFLDKSRPFQKKKFEGGRH